LKLLAGEKRMASSFGTYATLGKCVHIAEIARCYEVVDLLVFSKLFT